MRKILQVFKKLFFKNKKRTIYICDPDRATDCIKEGCWYCSGGPCRCTSKVKNAKLDEKGHPIVASDLDIWNDAYWEQLLFGFSDSQKKQGL